MPLDAAVRPVVWSEPGRTTLELKTGGWRTRRPLWVEATAPCRAACPAGEPIAGWIERARAGDWAGAWALIREENPFPAVMGRVCAHPCETACNRRALDSAVAINALERFVGDWGLRHGTVERSCARRPQRVAVVGAGPAGLACAHHLARFGYQVTAFEARPEPGGVLRYGIPAYRLPRDVLEREITLILGLGVELRTGARLGQDLTWEALAAFDAVFIATGAEAPLPLAVPGSERAAVRDGLAFLREVNSGEQPALGARVVVVGGGSTAMDVARTARRLGAPFVTVLALEAREAMPAVADEVEQALGEGIEIRNRVGVRAFREGAGAAVAVVTGAAQLGRTPDGAIVPVFEDGPEAVLDADTVLVAVGQQLDPAALPPDLPAPGGLAAVGADGATAGGRTFVGGDAASRQRTVAHAIGSGTRAARAIHARLSGETPGPSVEPAPWVVARPEHVVAPSEVAPHAFPRARRAAPWQQLPSQRVRSFAEVETGLEPPAALGEAGRCFTCGRCTRCDTCRQVCPDLAIARDDGAYRVSTDHCKGCGLCARECPRGALVMVDER